MTDSPRERARSLLGVAAKAADAYGRSELLDPIARAGERLDDPAVHVLVIGEFKKGKSTLVNALLNAKVCPASDDVATVVPTLVRHGAEVAAVALVDHVEPDDAGAAPTPSVSAGALPPPPPAGAVGATLPPTPAVSPQPPGPGDEPALEPHRLERRPVEITQIPALCAEVGDPDAREHIRMVEVSLPRRLLEQGLAFVDTPGVGGFNSLHGAATEAALSLADLVLFVTDASQELTATELDVIRRAHDRCPRMVVVLTKIDIHPHWRRIRELDQGHLARAGLDLEIVPVSSMLRQLAHERQNRDLNTESGFPALVTMLESAGAGEKAAEQVREALQQVRHAVGQMEQPFLAEKAILDDPEAAARVVAELEVARDRANALRSRSARWQQTLNDGAADLTGDIDHDLRRRLREITSAAENALDEHDPAAIWDEFAPWLEQRVAAEVAENAELVRNRAEQLAAKVADHFASDESAIEHGLDLPVPVFEDIDFDAHIDLGTQSMAASALTVARGAYGGVLMFGFVGQLAGLALLNPLALVVGIGLGRKALREEKKRSLTTRQSQAKAAVRKHIDAVSFAAGKETRDIARRLQRDLRDEFTARAERLQESTREALAAAERATKEELGTREQRRRDVTAELERLAKVRASADRIEASLAEPAGGA